MTETADAPARPRVILRRAGVVDPRPGAPRFLRYRVVLDGETIGTVESARSTDVRTVMTADGPVITRLKVWGWGYRDSPADITDDDRRTRWQAVIEVLTAYGLAEDVADVLARAARTETAADRAAEQ